MSEQVRGNTLERVWDKEKPGADLVSAIQPGGGRPIVRIVEEEHGWSQPSNAEHQRRIETIHPGPRPEDS
jgi:hypothetical protein